MLVCNSISITRIIDVIVQTTVLSLCIEQEVVCSYGHSLAGINLCVGGCNVKIVFAKASKLNDATNLCFCTSSNGATEGNKVEVIQTAE